MVQRRLVHLCCHAVAHPAVARVRHGTARGDGLGLSTCWQAAGGLRVLEWPPASAAAGRGVAGVAAWPADALSIMCELWVAQVMCVHGERLVGGEAMQRARGVHSASTAHAAAEPPRPLQLLPVSR